MSKPALIIMAAGIGSRYGGLKQVDPIGPNGEIIIDYSIYDALRSEFGKIVFLIRRDIEEIFREKIGKKIEQRADVAYVFQELNNLPAGFSLPPERKKPWGTAHAVLSCKDAVDTPFAVINADDFYGPSAFQTLSGYLEHAQDRDGIQDDCMVGYRLHNTLSEHGSVARGVCEVTINGFLKGVTERTRIERRGDSICYTDNGSDWIPLSPDSLVSMNMFGFTPSFFEELEARFPIFLKNHADNLEKAEYFLPSVVNALVEERKAQVKVLPTHERWYGVTNPADRPSVQKAIREMVERGMYPRNLWE